MSSLYNQALWGQSLETSLVSFESIWVHSDDVTFDSMKEAE
jgi:hypothetical protein